MSGQESLDATYTRGGLRLKYEAGASDPGDSPVTLSMSGVL